MEKLIKNKTIYIDASFIPFFFIHSTFDTNNDDEDNPQRENFIEFDCICI